MFVMKQEDITICDVSTAEIESLLSVTKADARQHLLKLNIFKWTDQDNLHPSILSELVKKPLNH